VHRPLVGLVAGPVAVGFLDDDVSLYEEAFEDLADLEPGEFGLAGADGDVFKVAENREDGGAVAFRSDGGGVGKTGLPIVHLWLLPSDL
jgi:hypothetical protein